MRLHRFYTKENLHVGNDISISDEALIHQWRKVFRLKTGDKVILFNNSGNEFGATILALNNEEASLSLDSIFSPKIESNKKITLATAIPKKDKFEWVLEKGTEIGVSRFVPIISERTEKKQIDQERSQKIIIEATEQSGRVILPVLSQPIELEDFLADGEQFIACDESGDQHISDFKNKEEACVLIGPEGGWSEKELEFFKQKNIPVVKIGNTVLRAETAAIVAASQLIF